MSQNYINNVIERTETFDTRESINKHTNADIKKSLIEYKSEYKFFLHECKDIMLSHTQKEDINTQMFLDEELDFFTLRTNTEILRNTFSELDDDVMEYFSISNGDKQVDTININGQELYVDEDSIRKLSHNMSLFNEFLILFQVDGDVLKINTVPSEKYNFYMEGNTEVIEVYQKVDESRFMEMKWVRDYVNLQATVETLLWTKKEKAMGNEEKWLSNVYIPASDIEYTMFPIVMENDKLVNNAIKSQILSQSELMTSFHKEIKINPSKEIYREGELEEGTIDKYSNATLVMKAPMNINGLPTNSEVPGMIVQGTMRADQYSQMEESIDNRIKALIVKTNTKLGLAPGDSAVENAKERNVNFINGRRRLIASTLTYLINILTQGEYKVGYIEKESQSARNIAETESVKLANGQTTEYYAAKRLNPTLSDDDVWTIALTKLIRDAKPMTEKEKAKALELGLINPTTDVAIELGSV